MRSITLTAETCGSFRPRSSGKTQRTSAGADSGREVARELADGGQACLLAGGSQQPLDERGPDDYPVREPGYLGGLPAVPDPEPDRYRQLGELPGAAHQALRVAADRVPGSGDAHQRGGVHEPA